MIGDSIGKGVQAKQQLRASKKAQQEARDDRERAVWMTDPQDWTPEYVSDHVGPYQRSTSPVAQGFLESLMTGTNPAAVQGTRSGAPQMKARAQQQFDRQTGGWDALRARQREMESSTPWDVKPFTRQISQPDVSREAWEAHRVGGMSADEFEQLERDGFRFTPEGEFRTNRSAKDAKKAMTLGTGQTSGRGGTADTPEGRAFMRGLARARAQGMTLNEALALGRDELTRRGA